jgi:hypothetical protein
LLFLKNYIRIREKSAGGISFLFCPLFVIKDKIKLSKGQAWQNAGANRKCREERT